jgi:DNA-binding IclR family transcriptional regulator
MMEEETEMVAEVPVTVIAEETGLSEREVRRCLKSLEAKGWLEPLPSTGIGRRYRVINRAKGEGPEMETPEHDLGRSKKKGD